MDELAGEHEYIGGIVRHWVTAAESYFAGKDSHYGLPSGIGRILPRHIAKEEIFFFGHVLSCFNPDEQTDLIRKFEEFEHNVLFWKYRKVQSTLKDMLDDIRETSA